MSTIKDDGQGREGLRRTAEDAGARAEERAKALGAEARGEAERLAESARARAEAEAQSVKAEGVSRARNVAAALDRAAGELDNGYATETLRSAAEGIGEIADSLESRSLGELVEGVQRFGRRNPAVFLGGAAIAGFALARFATATRSGYDDGLHDNWDDRHDAGLPARRTPSGASAETDPPGLARSGSAGTGTGGIGAATEPGGGTVGGQALHDSDRGARGATAPTSPGTRSL